MLKINRVACVTLLAVVGVPGIGCPEVALAADAIQVAGRALDAETGKVIPQVRVVATSVQGDNLKRGQVTWQMHLLKSFEGGSIDFRMERGYSETVVRIDADGYRPFITPVVEKGQPLRQDFVLKRDGIQGIVLTPDGKPAANAQVAMSTWTLEVNVEEGRLRYVRDLKKFGREIVETDAGGRFTLPAETDPLTIVVAHASGYVQQPVRPETDAATGTDATKPEGSQPASPASEAVESADPRNLRLTLQAWGRISGHLIGPDQKPVEGRTLWISGGWPGRNDPGHVRHSVTRVTDKDGRFSVEPVAPGTGSVQHAFENSEGKGSFSPIGLTAGFSLKSGQTLELTPGQVEQPVVGKLLVPDELKTADLSAANFRVFLHDISWKQSFGGGPVVTYPGWTKFNASPEAKHYRLDDATPATAPDRVSIDKDGRFEIRGLPAARYVVQIRLEKGFGVTRFVVPLNSTEPVDLGELTLRIN